MGIKDFLKGSSILVLSNIALKAVNFFLLPLYTKYLTPDMLGVSDSITTFTGLLLPLLTMGLDSAYSAFYFDPGDAQRSQKVYSSLLLAFSLLGLIPLFLTPFSAPLSGLLFHTDAYALIVAAALLSVSLNLWFLPLSLELRMKNRMLLFGLSNLSASLTMIALNILFIVKWRYGESALILSSMIAHAEQLAFLCLAVRQAPRKRFVSFPLLKQMLRFSLPILPMTLMLWILALSDRSILLRDWGSGAVGVYGVAMRFVTVLNIVVSAVSMAYTTFAFSSKDSPEAKKQYRLVFTVESVLLAFLSFTVSLFGKEVILLMADAAYSQAYRPLRDLIFAQSVYAMTTIVSYGIMFEKKSVFSLLAVSAGALTNLGLNLALIPRYGISAAALTTLIGYLLNFILTYVFSERLYPCDYGLSRTGPLTAALYALSLLGADWPVTVKAALWLGSLAATLILFRDMLDAVRKRLLRKAAQERDST